MLKKTFVDKSRPRPRKGRGRLAHAYLWPSSDVILGRVRRHPRTWPWWLAAGLLVAGAVFAVARADRPPFSLMQSSRKAVAMSRETAVAVAWAPELVQAAEDSLASASRQIDHQLHRWLVVRDFDAARSGAAAAQRLALAALREGGVRRDSMRTVAFERLDRARTALEMARQSMTYVQMDGYSRSRLVRLDVLRGEALKETADGKYRSAVDKAQAVMEGAAGIQRAVDGRILDYQQSERLWNVWARETVNWSRRNSAYVILVRKLDHRCDLYYAGRIKTSYPAELGLRRMGHKVRRGDGATPEGRYYITRKKSPATYHKALEINYPNEEDQRRFQLAKRQGLIPRSAAIGGLIQIHGFGGRGTDWTSGCVALRNEEIDKLFSLVSVGTPVTIVGTWSGAGTNAGNAR